MAITRGLLNHFQILVLGKLSTTRIYSNVFKNQRATSKISDIVQHFYSLHRKLTPGLLKRYCYQPVNQHIQGRLYSTRFMSNCTKMCTDDDLQGLDETQVRLLEEKCILVDENDQAIGSATKKECHLLKNIDKGMLHRAFSVFLFNQSGELLLQQRADSKITFPGHYTNSCCSHPLNILGEIDESEAIGVKRAAQRKLLHELGIKAHQVPLDDFNYITRILYKAENVPKDGKWGENEIDYILFIQANVDIFANFNEVKDYKYVSITELKEIIETADRKDILITPWFKLIVKNFLFDWWKDLDNISLHKDEETIHHMD